MTVLDLMTMLAQCDLSDTVAVAIRAVTAEAELIVSRYSVEDYRITGVYVQRVGHKLRQLTP